MSRALALPLLLVSLSIGGFLFVRQSQQAGPASPAVTEAATAAAGASFAAAAPTLEAWFVDHGTYAGVTLPPAYGLAVVRADATSFCLQAGAGPLPTHEVGPHGTPAPGPC